MHKVHLLRPTIDYISRHGPRRTFCGMFGWLAKDAHTEYETVKGNRFEAVERNEGITCRRCNSRRR